MSMHNARTGGDLSNVDLYLSHNNITLVGSGNFYKDIIPYINKYKQARSTGKKPSPFGQEHLMTADAEYFKQPGVDFMKWAYASLAWLKNTFDTPYIKRVVSAELHLDEEAINLHAFVLSLSEVTLPNTNGKKEIRFCYSKTNGTPRGGNIHNSPIYKRRQDEYADAMAPYGLVRGEEGSEEKNVRPKEYRKKQLEYIENVFKDMEKRLEDVDPAEKITLTKQELEALRAGWRLSDHAKMDELLKQNKRLKAVLQDRDEVAEILGCPANNLVGFAERLKAGLELQNQTPDDVAAQGAPAFPKKTKKELKQAKRAQNRAEGKPGWVQGTPPKPTVAKPISAAVKPIPTFVSNPAEQVAPLIPAQSAVVKTVNSHM